jgi:hypothetical protein
MSSHLSQECTRAQEVDKSLSAMGGVAQLSQRPESQQFKQPHPLASNSHRHVRPAGPKRSRRQQKKNSQTQGEEPRRSYRTFGLEKCREIDRDNLLLVKNLAAISLRRQPMFGPPATKPKAKKKGDKIKLTMSLNRRKVEDRIARENLVSALHLASEYIPKLNSFRLPGHK